MFVCPLEKIEYAMEYLNPVEVRIPTQKPVHIIQFNNAYINGTVSLNISLNGFIILL
jgi:hypothetical protein